MAKKATATKKAAPKKKAAKKPLVTAAACLVGNATAVPTLKILGNSVGFGTLSVPVGTQVTVMGFASYSLIGGLSAILISVDDDRVTAAVQNQPAPASRTRWQAIFTMPAGDWIFEVSGSLGGGSGTVTYTDDLEFRSS